MTDVPSKPPTTGFVDGPETPETTEETPRTQYVTGTGKHVGIRHYDPSFHVTEPWLESQARTAASGGAFGSEINMARIAELVEEIRSFEYDRYRTPMKYAKKWGITARYVRNLCAQAIKVVREEVTDEDYVTSTVCEALDKVIRDNIKNPRVGNQKLVVQAAKVWSEIAGVRAPVELRLSRGTDELPNDPQQLRAMAARLLGQNVEVEVIDAQASSNPAGVGGPAMEAERGETDE